MIRPNKERDEWQNNPIESNNDSLNQSIQKVAKGTVIIFIGLIIGMLFAFAGRILFARFFDSYEYGVFSMGITILSLSVTIGTLGLSAGTTRQIAYYLAKKETKKVQFIIFWSLVFGIVSSIITSLLILFSSDFLAFHIFNMPSLSFTLKIFSITIPFYVLLFLFSSIFAGFKKVEGKVYFRDLLRNALFPILLIPVLLLNLSFEWGITFYAFSIILTCNVFVVYFIKKKPISLQLPATSRDILVGKELLIFSIPLLIVLILELVMHWTDTLMLGYFKTADVVGLYNAASPLGSFISTGLTAMIFIYIPIVSELYAKNNDNEMRKSYAILTKWLCAATLPLALLFLLFPNVVLNFFFGPEYVVGMRVLQILAVGFFINNLMGPNGATLTAMGKTKFLMWATFVAVCINVGLNALLIPKYGINGAAISTVCAMVSINIIRCIKLYSISKIHSFKKNILKPIFLSVILIFLIYFIATELLTITFWMLPVLFVIFIILYSISLLLTKSFDKEDIDMILKIEQKTGVNLTKVKRIIMKFI